MHSHIEASTGADVGGSWQGCSQQQPSCSQGAGNSISGDSEEGPTKAEVLGWGSKVQSRKEATARRQEGAAEGFGNRRNGRQAQ